MRMTSMGHTCVFISNDEFLFPNLGEVEMGPLWASVAYLPGTVLQPLFPSAVKELCLRFKNTEQEQAALAAGALATACRRRSREKHVQLYTEA